MEGRQTLPIGGQGGWDHLTVDPQTHRAVRPISTHTVVIESASGQVIADTPGQKNDPRALAALLDAGGIVFDEAGGHRLFLGCRPLKLIAKSTADGGVERG